MSSIYFKFNDMIIDSNHVSKLVVENSYQLVKIKKVEVNVNYKNNIVKAIYALQLMFGRKALIIKAKKSVASFNLREGTIVSYKITLQRRETYDFLNILSKKVLPRLNTKHIYVDPKCNINIGIADIKIFPQVSSEYDRISANIGANISIMLNNLDKRNSSLFLSDLLKYPIK